MDPDERLEAQAPQRIRACMSKAPAIWKFKVCELYEVDKYRSDGLWNRKEVLRLFPVSADMVFEYEEIHSNFPPIYPIYSVRPSHLNIYHLKMLDPRRRTGRRDLYNALDPDRSFQQIGYDYLAEEEGLELTEIPPGRNYVPRHHDDGGLWMANLREHSCQQNVTEVQTEKSDRADVSQATSKAEITECDELQTKADILSRCGLDRERRALFTTAGKDVRCDARIDKLRFRPPLGSATSETCFSDMGWTKGEVTIHWGADAEVFAPMAAVAIGLGAPRELKEAVESLLAQTPTATVIVVNSGGGDLLALLEDLAPRVIAISIPETVYVGAARNIGMHITNATWISFLAGDSIARPYWIECRLAMHRAGFGAVSSPVVNDRPDSAVAWAYHVSLYLLRLPDTPERYRLDYGLSFERSLIPDAGYFDPSLRVGEDTMLKKRIVAKGPIGFAIGAVTEHKAESRLLYALAELIARSRRSVRMNPIMANRSLAPRIGRPWFALRRALRRSFTTRVTLVFRVRRGLAIPDKKSAYRRGLMLLPFFAAADMIGVLWEFPRKLRNRRKSQQVLVALKAKENDLALNALKSIKDPRPFDELPARELAGALALAGLTDAALQVLDRISPAYPVSSDIERLRKAIRKGKFARKSA